MCGTMTTIGGTTGSKTERAYAWWRRRGVAAGVFVPACVLAILGVAAACGSSSSPPAEDDTEGGPPTGSGSSGSSGSGTNGTSGGSSGSGATGAGASSGSSVGSDDATDDGGPLTTSDAESSDAQSTDAGSSAGDGAVVDGGQGAQEAGDAGAYDVPDAFPASCPQFSFPLRLDAAADTCAFSPTDVACTTDSDCVAYPVVGCGCFDPIYGVNKTGTERCIPPPCPPPTEACAPDASGLYLTQDCQFVDNSIYTRTVVSGDIVKVACVNHQCETYAAPLH
jgi:hypothetical protein